MKEYTISGPAGDYTVQLEDDEAKAQGLKAKADEKPVTKAAAAPANKARAATTVKNK